MRHAAAASAAVLLLVSSTAQAQETPPTPAAPLVAPFDDNLAVRADHAAVLKGPAAPGEAVASFGVQWRRTARLTADAKFRGENLFGKPPEPLPAGLSLYHVDFDTRSSYVSAYGIGFEAWCAPERQVCAIYRQGALASKDAQLASVADQHPLMVVGVELKGGWGPRLQLEETAVDLPGEMTAEVLYGGVKNGLMTVKLRVTAHIDGRPDAVRTADYQTAMRSDGTARFDFGPTGRMHLQPQADGRVTARFDGPIAALFTPA